MSTGYTYTTISAHPGDPVRIGVSFYLDQDAWIVVPGAGTDKPHLTIAHGDVSVHIGPRTDPVTGEDARLARHLAEQAVTYAAEIERLAASSEAARPGTTAA
ncbi:MAG: hypothetical protein ACRDPY_28435 [Streptosporangiaceae bacterium]